MKRTSWAQAGQFVVEARYSVSGVNKPTRFPYVNDLPSLRNAISIARTYQGTNTTKGAGRVTRHIRVFYPHGTSNGCSQWQTHEWYVYANGKIENTGWGKGRRRKSVSQTVDEGLAEQAQHKAMMAEAAKRTTEGMDVLQYNRLVEVVLSTILEAGRAAGFVTTYVADPHEQGKHAATLSSFLNENLAQAGMRTVPAEIAQQMLNRVFEFDQALEVGVFGNRTKMKKAA